MGQFGVKIKGILSSKILLCLATFVLIGLVVNLGQESYRKYRLNKEIGDLKSQIETLENSNQQLNGLMDYFGQNSYLEKEARVKFNLKKPDEKVVILSDGASNQSYSKPSGNFASSSIKQADTANYWKWWEYFFSS